MLSKEEEGECVHPEVIRHNTTSVPFTLKGPRSVSFASHLCSQLKYAKWSFSLSSLKCAIHSNMRGNCPQLAEKKNEVVVEQGGKEGINYANNTKDFTTWKPNFPIISTLSANIFFPTSY